MMAELTRLGFIVYPCRLRTTHLIDALSWYPLGMQIRGNIERDSDNGDNDWIEGKTRRTVESE